jgi:predicted MFS family arabinose efflux permease
MFMTSLCTSFYQFFLAQGFLLGVGIACLFTPAIATINLTFRRSRGLALGIVVSGSSLGGVIWPILLRYLLQNIGFGWTIRIAAFMMLGLCGIACLTVRRQPIPVSQSPASRAPIDLASIFRNVELMVLAAALFFIYLGLFAPFFYVASYTISLGLNANMAFYMIAILNAASVFGRLIPGFLADKYGAYNLFIVASGTSAIVVLCWSTATSIAGIAIWSAAYGFSSGVSQNELCAPRNQKTDADNHRPS